MISKKLLQFSALGTFGFALGIISTLGIQAFNTPGTSSSLQESSLVLPSSSSSPSSSEVTSSLQPFMYPEFSSEMRNLGVEETEDIEAFRSFHVNDQFLPYLNEEYDDFDYIFYNSFFDSSITIVQYELVGVREGQSGNPSETFQGLLTLNEANQFRELPLNTSLAYAQSIDAIFNQSAIQFDENPLLWEDGAVFAIEYYAYYEENGETYWIDGDLNWLRNVPTDTAYNKGIFYWDFLTGGLYVVDHVSIPEGVSMEYEEMHVYPPYFSFAISVEYEDYSEPFTLGDYTLQEGHIYAGLAQVWDVVSMRTGEKTLVDEYYISSNIEVLIDFSSPLTPNGNGTSFNLPIYEIQLEINQNTESPIFSIDIDGFENNEELETQLMELNDLSTFPLNFVLQDFRYSSLYDVRTNTFLLDFVEWYQVFSTFDIDYFTTVYYDQTTEQIYLAEHDIRFENDSLSNTITLILYDENYVEIGTHVLIEEQAFYSYSLVPMTHGGFLLLGETIAYPELNIEPQEEKPIGLMLMFDATFELIAHDIINFDTTGFYIWDFIFHDNTIYFLINAYDATEYFSIYEPFVLFDQNFFMFAIDLIYTN